MTVRVTADSAIAAVAKAAVPANLPVAGGTRTARAAVIGASGYTGSEFVRLALVHPGIEVAALVSRESEGRSAADLLPGFDPRAAGLPPVVGREELVARLENGAVDTVVACLPHGEWRDLAGTLPALGRLPARVIDLSSDHRDGSAGYVYGLPEAFREEIRAAARVANPGCYPTAAALALLPAARAGWLDGPVMVTALSGASGAGRGAVLRQSFVELDGGAAFYKVGTVHPHVAEMKRTLGRLASPAGGDAAFDLAFAPQLVPMARGILLTAQAPLSRPVSPAEAVERWRAQYAKEPFVRVLPDGEWPETRRVKGSNRVDIQVTTVFEGRTLLVTAAIDNLGKGAASQAIQNLNLMMGWPEETGLAVHGEPW